LTFKNLLNYKPIKITVSVNLSLKMRFGNRNSSGTFYPKKILKRISETIPFLFSGVEFQPVIKYATGTILPLILSQKR
jgi:hypothetical protein